MSNLHRETWRQMDCNGCRDLSTLGQMMNVGKTDKNNALSPLDIISGLTQKLKKLAPIAIR